MGIHTELRHNSYTSEMPGIPGVTWREGDTMLYIAAQGWAMNKSWSAGNILRWQIFVYQGAPEWAVIGCNMKTMASITLWQVLDNPVFWLATSLRYSALIGGDPASDVTHQSKPPAQTCLLVGSLLITWLQILVKCVTWRGERNAEAWSLITPLSVIPGSILNSQECSPQPGKPFTCSLSGKLYEG